MRLVAESPTEQAVELVAGSIDLEHTALSSFSVETGYTETFEDAAEILAPCEFRIDEDLLIRGVLTRSDADRAGGSTTLEGRGRGWYLKRDEASVRYQNEYAHDALADYWEKTSFEADVTEPESEQVGDDVELQLAPEVDEFETLLEDAFDDTDPFEIVGDDEVHVLPVCDIDFRGSGSIEQDSNYIEVDGNTVDEDNTASYNVETAYDMESAEVAARLEVSDNDEHISFEILVDDTQVASYGSSTLPAGLFWITTDIDGTLDSGDHTVEFVDTYDDSAEDPGSTEPFVVDSAGIRDSRFDYNDVSSVDSDSHADGPERYPDGRDASALLFETAQGVRTISDARLEVEEKEDESFPEVALTFDDGSTWITEDDAFEVEAEANLPTNTVRGRVTFGRYGDRTDDSPKKGYKGHKLTFYRLGVDTESRAVIEDQTFTNDHLTNIQNLHEQAKMRFVIDHAAEERKVASFPVGEPAPDAYEWNLINAQRDLNLNEYANRLILRGAQKPEDERLDDTDLRYEAVAQNDDEVARIADALGVSADEARITVTEVDTRLESASAVAQQVASRLNERVRERELTGVLTVQPTLVPPGYRYAIDAFDGAELDLQTVSFAPDGDGRLQFRDDETLVPAFGELSGDVNSVKESL